QVMACCVLQVPPSYLRHVASMLAGPALTSSGFRRTQVPMLRRHVGSAALAFLLSVLISSLPLLAYASPPDSSWFRGVYDSADFDDVGCLIIAQAGLIDDAISVQGRPNFVVMGAEIPRHDPFVVSLPLQSSQSRAPPTL